jgi:hypothetical protein
MALRNCGGLWRPKKEDSKAILSGSIEATILSEAVRAASRGEAIRVVVFKNEDKAAAVEAGKKGATSWPDYRLCVSNEEEKEGAAAPGDSSVPF